MKAATKTKRARPTKAIMLRDAPPGGGPISEAQALIAAITKASRDPKVDIAKMQWLLDTRSKLLAEEAEQDFNDALGRVQAALEPVRKDAANPQTHSRYATLASLDAAIRPYYSPEGFALSFDTADHVDPLTINVICYVTRGRHKRIYTIPMPIDGKGARGGDVMSRTHATGSGVSYGRRYLESMIFNVIIAGDRDDDGNRASGYRAPPAYQDGTAHDPLESGDLATKAQLMALRAIMKRAQVPADLVLETFGIERLEELTQHQCNQAVKKANKKLELMFAEEKANAAEAAKDLPRREDTFPGDLP